MNQLVRDTVTATALPVPLTRQALLAIAANALDAKKQTLYQTIFRVESMAPSVLAATPTTGTIFDPVVTALNAHGVPTEETVGDVMRVLDLDAHDVHMIACWCHEESHRMMALTGATRLRDIAEADPASG